MQRKRFEIKKNNSTFALNITSMTDMFTILLVFLLQTYSTSDVQIIPEKDIRLPASSVEINPVKSLNITVSQNFLKIEGKVITELKEGIFNSKDIDKNDTNFITPLFAELNKIEKENKNEFIKEGKILMQADSNLSYQTLRKVMYTASMAGFPKLKMATIVGN